MGSFSLRSGSFFASSFPSPPRVPRVLQVPYGNSVAVDRCRGMRHNTQRLHSDWEEALFAVGRSPCRIMNHRATLFLLYRLKRARLRRSAENGWFDVIGWLSFFVSADRKAQDRRITIPYASGVVSF